MLLKLQQQSHLVDAPPGQPRDLIGSAHKQAVRAENMFPQAVLVDRTGPPPALHLFAGNELNHLAILTAVKIDRPPVAQRYPHALLPSRRTGILVEPDIERDPAQLPLQMSLPFRGLRIAGGNRPTQTILRLPNPKVDSVVAAAGADRFPQHRQHVGANIKDHSVGMPQPARIRPAGSKIQRHRVAPLVKPAGLLEKTVNTHNILRRGEQRAAGLHAVLRLPAGIELAQRQLQRTVARHPVVQRQHPAGVFRCAQQRA